MGAVCPRSVHLDKMKTTYCQGLECVHLSNERLTLAVTQSVGPRVLSLRVDEGENIFAELPHVTIDTPGQRPYHFYGGHRFWYAPEDPKITYLPDDDPVEVTRIERGCEVVQPVEKKTGIQKALKIQIDCLRARVEIEHTLTNQGVSPITCAPWAITQLKLGGIVLLPLFNGLLEGNPTLPNRSITLWPYTDVSNPHITWENKLIIVYAQTDEPLKIGFPNPRGWMAYCLEDVLFVKRAAYDPQADYYDFGSSSECYCNHQFVELETLGKITTILPGESVLHNETWEIYTDLAWRDDLERTVSFIETVT